MWPSLLVSACGCALASASEWRRSFLAPDSSRPQQTGVNQTVPGWQAAVTKARSPAPPAAPRTGSPAPIERAARQAIASRASSAISLSNNHVYYICRSIPRHRYSNSGIATRQEPEERKGGLSVTWQRNISTVSRRVCPFGSEIGQTCALLVKEKSLPAERNVNQITIVSSLVEQRHSRTL